MSTTLILGGPGSGKTTRLLDILEKKFNEGLEPERVAFVSFTKKAVSEAKDRARAKFNFTHKQLPYFKTLHALAFAEMGLRRTDVFNHQHLKNLGELTRMEISPKSNFFTPFLSTEGDKSLFLENYARATNQSLEDVWHYLGEYLPWWSLKLFTDTLIKYKEAYALVDFTDMLLDYPKECEPLDIDLAIIDEAQDLNWAQWRVAEHAFFKTPEVYYAGDDDQAIYKWSGADVKKFLGINADVVETLPKSWRLGSDLFDYATNVIAKVSKRYNKRWGAADHDTSVRYLRSIEGLPLDEGNWFLLSRNKYYLQLYEDTCKRRGIMYQIMGDSPVKQGEIEIIKNFEHLKKGYSLPGRLVQPVLTMLGKENKLDPDELYKLDREYPIWHKAFINMPPDTRSYYVSLLRRGEKLTGRPRVIIDTIHGVKGGEADNVAVMLDMTNRSYKNLQFDFDDECRVFYVGFTRAKKNLYIILPTGHRYFPYD